MAWSCRYFIDLSIPVQAQYIFPSPYSDFLQWVWKPSCHPNLEKPSMVLVQPFSPLSWCSLLSSCRPSWCNLLPGKAGWKEQAAFVKIRQIKKLHANDDGSPDILSWQFRRSINKSFSGLPVDIQVHKGALTELPKSIARCSQAVWNSGHLDSLLGITSWVWPALSTSFYWFLEIWLLGYCKTNWHATRYSEKGGTWVRMSCSVMNLHSSSTHCSVIS